MFSLNKVLLCGTLVDPPVIDFLDSGTTHASFTLVTEEDGPQGQRFKTFVPCQCWGKIADVVSELAKGTAVLVEGKLKFTKGAPDSKKAGGLTVSVWTVQVMKAS